MKYALVNQFGKRVGDLEVSEKPLYGSFLLVEGTEYSVQDLPCPEGHPELEEGVQPLFVCTGGMWRPRGLTRVSVTR